MAPFSSTKEKEEKSSGLRPAMPVRGRRPRKGTQQCLEWERERGREPRNRI